MEKPWLKIGGADLRGIYDDSDYVPDESVDAIVTSPPYKRRDGLTLELCAALGRFSSRVLRPGGRLFVNFAQLRTEGFSKPYDAREEIEREAPRLKTGQTIIWVKSLAIDGKTRGHYTPIHPRSPTLNYGWEFVWTWFKPPESLDRLAVGVPFADKSNLKRGTRGKNGDLHCAGDVWFIPYKTTGAKTKKYTSGHKKAYEFPEELAERCLKVSGVMAGSVVCDPFLGGGTVACVAKRMGASAYGIEVDPDTAATARARWEEASVADA